MTFNKTYLIATVAMTEKTRHIPFIVQLRQPKEVITRVDQGYFVTKAAFQHSFHVQYHGHFG